MDPITINPNRIDLDEAYMQMAEVWGRRSKANRLQVGCLIVKDRQIISDGYNGMPAGAKDDTCEVYTADGSLATKREVLHAESNALMKISENGGVGAQGATVYTTWSPCFECSKLLRQAKVKRVVFRNIYRDSSGIDFLRSMGIQVDQLGAVARPAVVMAPAAPMPAEVVPPPAPANPTIPVEVVRPVPPPGRLMAETARPPKPTATETVDDVSGALAAAGIKLVNGVPVPITQAEAPKKSSLQDDTGYRSSFL